MFEFTESVLILCKRRCRTLALACALGSICRFLQGAWQLGIVEAVWMIVGVHWWREKKSTNVRRRDVKCGRVGGLR
jgi:tetrahydromethanopterin S-methyltransferase subunit C